VHSEASPPNGPERQRPDLSALRMERDVTPTVRRVRRPAWRWVVPVAVLLALGGAAVALPVPWLLPRVETTTVQIVTPTQASTVLTATGYTYARSRAAVGAKIVGRVVELRVEEGDKVAKGEVIAVLDSADLSAALRQAQARMLEAQAQVADARRESSRQQRLFDSGVGAQAELDAATTRLEVTQAQLGTAEAEVASAQARLDYAVVRAPIDGVVIEKNVEVGEMVAPGGFTSQQSTGSIVRIADPTSLEVEADINESYIARLRLGQPATVAVDAVPGVTYHGSLRQIVPTADRQRAVVQVKVTVDDRDARLVPDMSCNVTFLEEGTDAEQLRAAPKIVVPLAALAREGQAAFVWVVRDGRVHKTAVVLGETQGDVVTVASGVSGGETIVRDGTRELRDNARVRS
jgi:RND family efflux transporter MFP subunit